MFARECLEEFKVECDLRRLSPRTTKGYYNNTALFLNYLEKHENVTQLELIRPPHIKKYIQYLLNTFDFSSYDALLWAVESGVTNGMTKTTFAPNNSCTRGQIVTFLYRALS